MKSRVSDKEWHYQVFQLTLTPTVPPTSTRFTCVNFFSTSAISGSLIVRPMIRLRDPTVLRKFELSRVFADSPMARCFMPNETSDLGEK